MKRSRLDPWGLKPKNVREVLVNTREQVLQSDRWAPIPMGWLGYRRPSSPCHTRRPSGTRRRPRDTVTSCLFPWNTRGAYTAATLGVATVACVPFTFLDLLVSMIAIGYALTETFILGETRETT